MKKTLTVVILCILTVCCLCACKPNPYKELNDIAKQNFENVTLEAETTLDGDTLKSKFIAVTNDGKTTVTYSVQQFAKISIDNIPENFIETVSGTVVFANGEVVEQDGQNPEGGKITVPSVEGFTFKQEFFTEASFVNGVFSAKVKSPKEFFGDSTLSCKDMTVSFAYGNAQKVLTVTYTSASNASVKLTYTMK